MNHRDELASKSEAGARRSPRRTGRCLAALAISLLAFSAVGFSSEVQLGIHGGLNMPNIRGGNNPQSEGYVSRRAPFFGLTADFGITSHFSILAEINYSSQGGKRSGLQPVPADQVSGLMLPAGMTLYANFKDEAIIDYIEIPLMGRLSWGHRLKVFIQAGPYVGFRARAVEKTSGSSQLFLDSTGAIPLPDPTSGQPLPAVSFDASTNIKSDIKSTSAGITGGAGVATRVGPGDISLEGRFEVGLTNIQADTALNGENQTGAVVILLGYSLPLGARK